MQRGNMNAACVKYTVLPHCVSMLRQKITVYNNISCVAWYMRVANHTYSVARDAELRSNNTQHENIQCHGITKYLAVTVA